MVAPAILEGGFRNGRVLFSQKESRVSKPHYDAVACLRQSKPHPSARGELLENSVVGNRSCGHRTFLAAP